MFSNFTTEWNIYLRHFRHKRSEFSQHILSPQDWHCSVDLGQLSFSCFILQFAEWMTHFFLFPVYLIFFSIFGLGSGTIKTVPRSKFLFSWTIRPNPFTSRRMTRGNVSGLARSQPKGINSVFIHQIVFAFTWAVSSM